MLHLSNIDSQYCGTLPATDSSNIDGVASVLNHRSL